MLLIWFVIISKYTVLVINKPQANHPEMQGRDIQTSRQINISISKIFNWPESQAVCSFDLTFCPEDSDVEIIKKSVSGNYQANSMNLNALLKITYTNDENIVILRLCKYRREKSELLGEFKIDFDALREKGVQYFPFGKDFVLQINLHVPGKSRSRSSRAGDFTQDYQFNARLSSQQRIFGHRAVTTRESEAERRRTISRMQSPPSDQQQLHPYRYVNTQQYQPRMKKSFSQKVYSLLQQVKSMKEDIIVGPNKSSNSKNDSKQVNPNYRVSQQNYGLEQYEPRVKKTMSDSKFKNYGAVIGAVGPSFRRQEPSTKGPKAQKHRLILSTLNVVPCDQYYQKQSKPIKAQKQNKMFNRNNEPANNVKANGNNDYYVSRLS